MDKKITTPAITTLLGSLSPSEGVAAVRHDLVLAQLEDLRRIDDRLRQTRKKLTAAVHASGTSLTEIFGVGPVIAATVIGAAGDGRRFPTADRFAGLQRHRPDRSLVREPQGLPAVAARQPPHEPRHPHGRGHPDPEPAQRPCCGHSPGRVRNCSTPTRSRGCSGISQSRAPLLDLLGATRYDAWAEWMSGENAAISTS